MASNATGVAQPVRVGIVGLSARRGWGATAHLPALRAQPGYEVVALAAGSPASARAAAEHHGVAIACRDATELAEHPEVDLVVVAVKVPRHLALVTAAIEAGKDVLCEWPLGNGLAEAEQLAALAAQRGVRGFVGLQARAAPALRYVRDLVAAGEIGELLSTTLVGCGDRWGPTADADTLYLLDRDNGATLLTIPMGHALDGLCFCLGEITELSATMATRRPTVLRTDTGERVPMTAADQVAVTGVLEGGAVAAVHYRGGRPAGDGVRWEIDGTEGTIVLTGPTGHLQYGRVEVRLARAGARELTVLPVPSRYEAVAGVPDGLPYTVAQAYATLREDLVAGTSRAPTFADAVRRHHLLAAIETAAATGERQRVGPRAREEAHDPRGA